MIKTKRKIRKAFENVTPNVLSAVLSKTDMGNDESAQKRFQLKKFLATAAAVVLLFGVGYGAAAVLSGFQINIGSTNQQPTTDHSMYITEKEATDIALADMYANEKRDDLNISNLQTRLYNTETGKYYSVSFFFNNVSYPYSVIYDYTIYPETGMIKTMSVEGGRTNNEALDCISWIAARDAALKHAGVSIENLTGLEIELENDCIYSIDFCDQVYDYEYRIDGYNGKVLNRLLQNDDDKDPVTSSYQPRQYSVKTALAYAGVSYGELYYLESSSDYKSHPKIRTISFHTSETIYYYELYMDSQTVKHAEQYTPDVTVVTWKVALSEALKHNNLSLNLVSDLSFTLKDVYGQVSAGKAPVYMLTFTAHRDRYEATVDGFTGKVINIVKHGNIVQDYGSDIALPHLCANVAIDAAGVAKEEVVSLSTEFDTTGKFYKVKFTTESRSYTYSIDGKTKAILSFAPSVIISVPDKQIGSENAIKAALDDIGFPRSNVMYENAVLEEDNGSWYYFVSFWHDGYLYECKVNAVSGMVLDWDKEASDPASVDLIMTEDHSRAIRMSFIDTFVPEKERYNYTIDDLSVRYFGRYDDAMVVFVDGILNYDNAITFEVFGGVEFRYPSSQHLLVYYEDALMTLEDAYDEDVLAYKDIVLLSHHYAAT